MNFIETLKAKRFVLSNGETTEKLPFGKFFQLNKLREKLTEHFRKGNRLAFRETCLDIIELQTNKRETPTDFLSFFQDIFLIIAHNQIDAKAVFLKPPPKQGEREKPPRWSYDGRIMAQWVDMLASNYSWSLEKILNTNIDTVMYLLQEIMVREQFDKEWNYSLTEIAYQYDEGSKKSKLQKLPRPYWMDENVDAVLPKMKIAKKFLPYGVATDFSGIGIMSRETTQAKPDETITS